MGGEEDLLRQLLTVREAPGLIEADGEHESPVLAHEAGKGAAVSGLRLGYEVAWLRHFASVRFLCHHQYSGAGGPKSWVGIRPLGRNAASVRDTTSRTVPIWAAIS